MILERLLRSRGHSVTSCEAAEQALEALKEEFFPLIFLDIQLPGMSGLDFARVLRSRPEGDAHYILVGTGNSRPEDLRSILEAGADDYIAKPYQPALMNVRLAVAESAIQEIAKRKALEGRLRFLASHDPLTELHNRSILTEAIEDASARWDPDAPGALLYLDLDNFKIINDTLGHDVGDSLLIRVADILRRGSRRKDTLVRFGGDEFVIVLPECALEDARRRAEDLRDGLHGLAYVTQEKPLRVGVSIGVAALSPGTSAATIMSRADEACYAAKARGRNCVEIHTPETATIAGLVADTDWTLRIREAMNDGSLQLWYQPIVHLDSGQHFAQELLVRYEEHGNTVSPDVFLTALHRSGQMPRLDRFVMMRAFEMLALHADLTVSINISGLLFSDPDYGAFVESLLESSAIDPKRVLFEITEHNLISNLQSASGSITRLRDLGFRFGLDDFGSGFSSLSYLKMLPIDFIKIDGSFVSNLTTEPFQQALVRAIQGIADALQVDTIAEQVERREELDLLKEIGVRHAQGYLFAQPRKEPFTAAEIQAAFAANSSPKAG